MVVYSLILEVQSDIDKLSSMMSLPVSLKNIDPILEILTQHQLSDTKVHISVLHLCGQMLGSLEGVQILKFYWFLHISCSCLLYMECGNHFLAFFCPFSDGCHSNTRRHTLFLKTGTLYLCIFSYSKQVSYYFCWCLLGVSCMLEYGNGYLDH